MIHVSGPSQRPQWVIPARLGTPVGGIVQIIRNFLYGKFTRPCRAFLAVGVTALAVMLLFSPAASAAGGGSSDTASLSVAGPSPFPAQLSNPSTTGSRTATIHPVILNTGTAPASVTFSASLDVSSGNCTNPTITVTSDQPTPITLAAGASAAPMLTITMNQYCPGIDGTIIVMGGTGASPTSLRFALTNSVQETEYWYPIAGSFGAGVIFLAVMLILVGWRPGTKLFGKLGDTVATGSSWSFSSSWLTNITALGAVLGTVLGATGFLADVLPGTDTGRFTGLSVLFGALVIAAPIIYTAASKWVFVPSSGGNPHPNGNGSATDTLASMGRVWGVIAAAAVTLAGVVGELGTLVTLTNTTQGDDPAKDFVFAMLAAAAVITVCYSVAFVWGVSKKEITGAPAKLAQSSSGTL